MKKKRSNNKINTIKIIENKIIKILKCKYRLVNQSEIMNKKLIILNENRMTQYK